MTPAQAIEAARDNPAAFIALCLGAPVADIQRDLLALALGQHHWYAEIPRGHGKTSTIAYLMAWWIGRRPTTRFKIIGKTDPEAEDTSRFVRDIVGTDIYRAVFPSVTLKPGENTVTKWSVVVPGMLPRRDTTIQASGIFGRTSGRADILVLDDICDLRNSIIQPSQRAAVKEAVSNIWLPMLDPTSRHANRTWRTATPFHVDDITADWRRSFAESGALLRRPCVGLQSPWPEHFTPDVLEQRRRAMGPIAYARAYELQPLSSDLLVFRPEWVLGHLWTELPPMTRRVIAAVDWAYSAKSAQKPDPDWSVCQVARIAGNGDAYAVELLRVRAPLPEFRRQVAALCARHGVTTIYAEGNGPQDGAVQELRDCCRIPVVGLQRQTDKHWRAIEVQSFVAAGKYRLPAGEGGGVRADFAPLFDELVGFPAAEHDDCLDTAIDLCRQAMTDGQTMPKGAIQTVPAGDGRLFVPAQRASGVFAQRPRG